MVGRSITTFQSLPNRWKFKVSVCAGADAIQTVQIRRDLFRCPQDAEKVLACHFLDFLFRVAAFEKFAQQRRITRYVLKAGGRIVKAFVVGTDADIINADNGADVIDVVGHLQ
jgi:hypothetical protein